MLTEKEVSQQIGRAINSPIRIANLSDIGIEKEAFLAFFRPFFENLADDTYLIRQKQMIFLEENFKKDFTEINALHKDYFEGTIGCDALNKWVLQLNSIQLKAYQQLSVVTRQRNISTFTVSFEQNTPIIERIIVDDFQQEVTDFRVWKRIFEQAPSEAVEQAFFYNLLRKIALIVKELHPEVLKLKITSHFMRTIAQENIPGENAPEGVHEDGSQYIVSALVINRQNVEGGESSIFEKITATSKALIYKSILQPGEFIFQADTGEELTFGNDLWHNVTAIHPIDKTKLGIRDIIGLDIDLV